MKFVQDLMGGILVIFAAGVIAIAQNAVRDDKIPWIPKNPASVSEKSYTPPPSSHGSAPAPAAGEDVPAGERFFPGTAQRRGARLGRSVP